MAIDNDAYAVSGEGEGGGKVSGRAARFSHCCWAHQVCSDRVKVPFGYESGNGNADGNILQWYHVRNGRLPILFGLVKVTVSQGGERHVRLVKHGVVVTCSGTG